jgi:hypothetical protein
LRGHYRFGLAFELDPEPRLVGGDALDHTPETLASVYQLLQLYLGFMTRP